MSNVTLVQKFEADEEWSIYGLWRISAPTGVMEVGCVLGVPHRERAQIQRFAMNKEPYISAWYAASSDWETEDERDAALEILSDRAVELFVQHGGQL